MNSKNQILSEIEFSKLFSEKLKIKIGEVIIKSIVNLEIETEYNGKKGIKHFLENAYSEYKREPEELNEVIARYLNATDSIYSTETKLNTENILPVIKDYRYLEEVNRLREDAESELLYEKYNENLYVFYVEDTETCINYLNEEDLKNLKIQFSEIQEIAIQNLYNSVNIERHGENGYYMLVADGNYESSLILLDIWSPENFQVVGEIVIGIPSRDLLMITGSEDLNNLKKMRETIREINESGDHIVSKEVFILKDGKFNIL